MKVHPLVVVVVLIAIGVVGYLFFGIPVQNVEAPTDTKIEGPAPATVEEAEPQVVGTWRSIDDEKSVRVFNSDGSLVEMYDGEELATSAWSLFDDPTGEPVPDMEGAVYLKIVDEEEALYFTIAELTENSLALIYLDRGGVLRYEREN